MQLVTNRMLCIFNQVKLNTMEFTFEGDSSHKKFCCIQIAFWSRKMLEHSAIRCNWYGETISIRWNNMTLAKKYLFLTIWIIQIGPRYHLVIVIIGIYNEIVKYMYIEISKGTFKCKLICFMISWKNSITSEIPSYLSMIVQQFIRMN